MLRYPGVRKGDIPVEHVLRKGEVLSVEVTPRKRKCLITEMGPNLEGLRTNMEIINVQVFRFLLVRITKLYSSKTKATGPEMIAHQAHR